MARAVDQQEPNLLFAERDVIVVIARVKMEINHGKRLPAGLEAGDVR